ncbi:hypothetical protein BV22DRAFT_637799 [Leucogyrophana mollusca]|uniref:Uncharacterized protein n=1 Tax=Leucogyrophana mollusca TaxID=85980 RepID=A0ACB8BBU9_9AGAM|nr:hypothetical protein BV22DRAFT_637799 [Leucogyrophana mollusca]
MCALFIGGEHSRQPRPHHEGLFVGEHHSQQEAKDRRGYFRTFECQCAVCRVLIPAQVSDTMTSVMAPVLPHVAEEIHGVLREDESESHSAPLSFFTKAWSPLASRLLLVCSTLRMFSGDDKAQNGKTLKRDAM